MATLFQWEQEGQVRNLDPTGSKPDGECLPSNALILSGTAVTDASGHWTMELRPALCINAGIFEDPSMVATPTFHEENARPRPVFVTTEWRRPSPGNLFLGVRSWDANGQPAPKVPFSWHLRVYSIFVAAQEGGATA
jgi:hypothetical protein